LAKAPKPEAPGEQLVSDITYIPTAEGWLYLVIVMDLFSRAIVGWDLSTSLAAEGVQRAIERALKGPYARPRAIFHSDRGCQYTSGLVRQGLAAPQWRQSMSAKGYCYDNAFAESCFASLKHEMHPPRRTFRIPQTGSTSDLRLSRNLLQPQTPPQFTRLQITLSLSRALLPKPKSSS
jgi:transposase InsO family protein